jgi:hypothetical protein
MTAIAALLPEEDREISSPLNIDSVTVGKYTLCRCCTSATA